MGRSGVSNSGLTLPLPYGRGSAGPIQMRCGGLDPLYVANEGKLVAIVAPEDAAAVLEAMRAHPRGEEATIIGVVSDGSPGMVTMRTAFGSSRIVDMLPGDQLPRIC